MNHIALQRVLKAQILYIETNLRSKLRKLNCTKLLSAYLNITLKTIVVAFFSWYSSTFTKRGNHKTDSAIENKHQNVNHKLKNRFKIDCYLNWLNCYLIVLIRL